MQYSPFLKDMWQRTMKRLEETDRTLQILRICLGGPVSIPDKQSKLERLMQVGRKIQERKGKQWNFEPRLKRAGERTHLDTQKKG